jgi:Amidohydrolase family
MLASRTPLRSFRYATYLALGATLSIAWSPLLWGMASVYCQPGGTAKNGKPPPIAIEHVTVVPMTGAADELKDRLVIIREGRVADIRIGTVVESEHIGCHIDGYRKWLMPALADMHVHPENLRLLRLLTGDATLTAADVSDEDIFLPYVANGVLQILDMSAMSEAVGQRDDIDSGRVLGPHMALAALIDGSPPSWPEGLAHVAASPEDGRQVVRDLKAEGFDFIKVYTKLDFPAFSAIVDEARRNGMKVLGHIPGRKSADTERWFQPGFDMVAHLEEFAYQARDMTQAQAEIPRFVRIARDSGIGVETTVVLDKSLLAQLYRSETAVSHPELRYVHPATRAYWKIADPHAQRSDTLIARMEGLVTFNCRLVKALDDAGVPIYPGTDALMPGMVAGFSLHDELEALQMCGLKPRELLSAATIGAAQWLGVAADRGTLQVSKRADLLLLDSDPLIDVTNTRRIAAVFVGGRYLPRKALDSRLNALARRYASMSIPVAMLTPAAPNQRSKTN